MSAVRTRKPASVDGCVPDYSGSSAQIPPPSSGSSPAMRGSSSRSREDHPASASSFDTTPWATSMSIISGSPALGRLPRRREQPRTPAGGVKPTVAGFDPDLSDQRVASRRRKSPGRQASASQGVRQRKRAAGFPPPPGVFRLSVFYQRLLRLKNARRPVISYWLRPAVPIRNWPDDCAGGRSSNTFRTPAWNVQVSIFRRTVRS